MATCTGRLADAAVARCSNRVKSGVTPQVVVAANDRQVLVGAMCDSCWTSVIARQWWAGAASDEFAPDWVLNRLGTIDDEEVLAALCGRGVNALPPGVIALLGDRGFTPGSGDAVFVPLTEARASAPTGVPAARRGSSVVGRVVALGVLVAVTAGAYWAVGRWASEASVSADSMSSTSLAVTPSSTSSTSSTSTTDVSTTSTSVAVTTTMAPVTTLASVPVVVPVTAVTPVTAATKVTATSATSPPAPAPVVTAPPATSPPAPAEPVGYEVPDASALDCSLASPSSISWSGSGVSQVVLKLNGAPVKSVAGSSISFSPSGELGVWSVDLTVTGGYSGYMSAPGCM